MEDKRQMLEQWLKQKPVRRYADMLDKALTDSGQKLVSIANECRDRGVEITDSTLSKLRKGHQLPPVEPEPDTKKKSTNRMLAQILGIDEESFVLAAALEHTPLPVLEFVGLELRTTLAYLALALQDSGREREYDQAMLLISVSDWFANLYGKKAKKRVPLHRDLVPMASHETIKSLIKALAREAEIPASAIGAAVAAAKSIHTYEKRNLDW